MLKEWLRVESTTGGYIFWDSWPWKRRRRRRRTIARKSGRGRRKQKRSFWEEQLVKSPPQQFSLGLVFAFTV